MLLLWWGGWRGTWDLINSSPHRMYSCEHFEFSEEGVFWLAAGEEKMKGRKKKVLK